MVILQKMNFKEAFDMVEDVAMGVAAEDGGKFGEG